MGADIEKLDTSEYLKYIQIVDDKIRERGINPFYYPEWIFKMFGLKKEMVTLTNKLHSFTSNLIKIRRPIFESSPSRLKLRDNGKTTENTEEDNM